MSSPRIHMDPADAAIIAALAEHMQKVLDALYAFGRVGPKWSIAPDSPAEKEHALLLRQYGPGGPWTGDAAEYVADAALLFLLAQADHLAVLQQIYSTYTGLMFGVGPPARSVLELNGYVFWLLHPDVDSIRTRASRALLSQLNDATRERSAATALDAPAQMRVEKGQAVRDVKDRIEAQLYPSEVVLNERGDRILRGEGHPGPGRALDYLAVAGTDSWNSQGAYAFLSNAAHPTLHVITDTIQRDANGVSLHFGHPDTVYHYRLAKMAMGGILSTWKLAAAYRGLDQEPANQLVRELNALPEPAAEGTDPPK